MKFAIDCDGTITRYPELFVVIGRALKQAGHEVFILTGIDMSTFVNKRVPKYGVFRDVGWYDEVLTSDLYNDNERRLAVEVIAGRLDNHVLVGIFKRRICSEKGIALLFDDDVEHVRAKGDVPVFGVAGQ
jgi:hypothetical protein